MSTESVVTTAKMPPVRPSALLDHATNTVIAYVFDQRNDMVFQELKERLDPLGISLYYTDDWGV